MNRRLPALAAALAVTPAGVVAIADAAGSPSAAATGQTLKLVARPTGGGQIDNRPKGPSAGDQFFESGTLSDPAQHRLGRFTLTAELVAGGARHGSEQSTVVAFLPGGQIVMTGGHATTDRFIAPVVGGTGRYAGARGTATIAAGAHGRENVTVELEG